MPALRRGAFVPLYVDDPANVYAFVRRLDRESLIVILNNGERPYKVRVPVHGELADGIRLVDLLEGGEYLVQDGAIVGPTLLPRSGLVLQALQP